jgi:phosphopantothenoylcysteine synthetase/decarboxylase
MTDAQTAQTAPQFTAGRLLCVCTGSIAAMFFPSWLHWLRVNYPALELRYVMTRSATGFAGTQAVAATGRAGPPLIDVWPEASDAGDAVHVELASWPDAILVHPATLAFTARYALGLADSPAMLALQCTSAPVAIAPALPPGGFASAAYRAHLSNLTSRPNTVVVPPVTGYSMATLEEGVGTVAPFPACLRALEQLRSRASARQEGDVAS